MRWTRKAIIEEIRTLHTAGDELNYSSAEENHLNLVRAAAWHYGTWKRAIETAGLSYDDISKYRRWNRERILKGILDYQAAGGDLSWLVISSEGAPALAAAAVRENVGFDTWYDAVTAAGIDYEKVARYRHWTPERVVKEIQELAEKEAPLSSKLVQQNHPPLYNAAKRRFKQWDEALMAAGINPDKVRQRRLANDLQKNRRSRNEKGELTFEHMTRDEGRKTRAQPKKSLMPVPIQAEQIEAPPRVDPLPLRKRDPKTGEKKVRPRTRDVYKTREKEITKRAKILLKAAVKKGMQPEKNGHARRKELQNERTGQMALELSGEKVAS